MNAQQNSTINQLFIKLEAATKWSIRLNERALFSEGNRDAVNIVFEEVMAEIAIIQKRLIRTFFKAGAIGELECHIQAGTFPPKAIHAALGRI